MYSSFPPNGRIFCPSVPIQLSNNQPAWPGKSNAASVEAAASTATNHETPQKGDDDYSVWRHTALRYGGYADEMGEFLAPYLGGLGRFAGYGLAALYCLADMGTTLPKKYAKGSENGLSPTQKTVKTAQEAADLALFHLAASLWIPPMLIGSVVDLTSKLLDSKAHVEMSGDPLRKRIMTGLNKLVAPVTKQSQGWIDRHWVEPLKPFVETRLKAVADRQIQALNGRLARVVGVFASLSDWVAKTPGLRSVWTLKNAGEIRRNMKQIGAKTQFGVDELTRLLFVKPLPVLIGIALVPLVSHPFDQLMVLFEDWTLRLLSGKNRLTRLPDGKLKPMRNPAYWQAVAETFPETTKPAVGTCQPAPSAGYYTQRQLYGSSAERPFQPKNAFGVWDKSGLSINPARHGEAIIL